MVEALISGSVLILGIAAVRRLLAGRAAPEVLYALWGLAAVRLLVGCFAPFAAWQKTFASRASVMNVTERVWERMAAGRAAVDTVAAGGSPGAMPGGSVSPVPMETAAGTAEIDWAFLGTAALGIWIVGAVLLGIWFLWVNGRFLMGLYRERRFLFLAGEILPELPNDRRVARLPVYETGRITSPCLAGGLGEWAVYLPAGMEEELRGSRGLHHILAHECCHARHWDGLWGIIRCLLLCLYWVNPFVWAAALWSRQDCETACDAAAVRLLGEEERLSYGRTLVAMLERASAGSLFSTAAAIESGGASMKQRLQVLTARPKTTLAAAVILLGTVAVLGACTFTAGMETEGETGVLEAASEPAAETGIQWESAPEMEPERPLPVETEAPIPEADYLEVVSETRYGDHYHLGVVMRRGITGDLIPYSELWGGRGSMSAIFWKAIDEEGERLSVNMLPSYVAYGTDNEEYTFFCSVQNPEGKPAIRLSAEYAGRTYETFYQFQSPEDPVLDTETQTIYGEDGAYELTVEMRRYSQALIFDVETEGDISILAVHLSDYEGYPHPLRGFQDSFVDDMGNGEYLYILGEPEELGKTKFLICTLDGAADEPYAAVPIPPRLLGIR